MANDTDPKAFPQDKNLPNRDPIIRQTDCQYSFGKDAITLTLKFLGDTSEAVELASSYRMGTRVNKSTLITDFGKADPKGELSSRIFNGVANSGKVLSSTSQTKTGCGSATVVVEMPYEDRIDIKLTGDNPDMRVVETWSEKSTNHEFPLEVYAGEGDPNAGQLDAWRKMKDQNMNLYSSFKYTVEGQDEPVELKDKTRKLAEKIYRGGEAVSRAYPEVIRTTQYYYVKSGTKDKVDKKVIDELAPTRATGVGTNTTSAAVKLYYRDQTPNAIWKGKFKDFDWLYASYDVECQPTEYQYYWNVTVTESWMGIDTVERGTWDKNLYGEANDRWPFADVKKSTPQGNYDDDAPIEPEDVDGTGRVKPDTFTNQSDIKTIDLGTDFYAVDANSFRAAPTRGGGLLRSAPAGAPALESITMPSVSFIGNDAFNGAANLQSIALPNRISFLGERVFKDCSAMTEAIVEPSIYELPASTFEGCSSLNASQGGTFTVGGLVNSLGEYAFKDCTALTAINCTNALTSIGANAFENDDALTSFTMGVNSTGSITIGDEAFKGCGALADIELPVPTITVGTDSFLNAFASEVTVKAPKSFLANLPNASSYNYIYPAFVDTIANDEFRNDTKLLSVVVPNTVTTMGTWAFAGCTNLVSATLPDNLTTVKVALFDGCTALTTVTYDGPITQISSQAFRGCTSLTSTYIPDTVTFIGSYAYQRDPLVEVDIPSTINLQAGVFQLCSALKSVKAPESETGSITLNARVFQGCSALERIELPVGTITISDTSTLFLDALASEFWLKAPFNSNLIASIPSSKRINFIYPSFTTSIAANEWKDNTKLKSVALPDTITNIGHDAFRNTSITTFTVPPLITTLVYQMFYQCLTLESLDLNNVTQVGADICNGCSALDELLNADKLVTIGQRAFMGTAITEFTGGSNLATVGASAFKNCTALTEATFPAATTSMGATVFQGCTSLTEITMTGKEMATVQGMTNYPFGLAAGQTIHCSDGDITI